MNGVVVIDKEQGYTSFDVVAVVRKTLGTKKVGHCGTLDPNATGVLPVLVGNATKAQDIIPNHDKSYVADFKFGTATDTLDIWGKVVSEQACAVTTEQLHKAAESFVGDIMQTPPMYSAVQKDGVRLYDLARQGIEVERTPRKVTIYSLSIDKFDESTQCGTLSVSCSKGTYIRQLIYDIAERLGTIAVMTALERTSACGFDIKYAIKLDKLKELKENEAINTKLLSTESLFDKYPIITVSDKQAVRFKNGNPLDIERTKLKDTDVSDGAIYRVKWGDEFLSLGIIDLSKGVVKIYKHFGS